MQRNAGEWSFTGAKRVVRRPRGGRQRTTTLLALLGMVVLACSPSQQSRAAGQERIDKAALLADVEALSAERMQGRRTGTAGHERARNYLVRAFEENGLEAVGGSFLHPFTFTLRDRSLRGWNVIGVVRGTENSERFIVVTGHYDHLGIQNDQLFPGADDNASGAAAVVALGGYFRNNPPRHSILFMTPDAEELGLRGARAFVADPPVPGESIVMNVNLDMISHNDRGELYAAGLHHYPFLERRLDRVVPAAGVTLLRGHDRPEPQPEDDWTMLSDHGAFHEAGIPFLYFGVEDHAHYHKPTDTFDNIHPAFYHGAVETILSVLLVLDEELEAIAEEAGRAPATAGRD